MLTLKDLNELHDQDKLIGMFEVEHQAYHDGPGISSTNLIDILTYSEAHFKYWKENPVPPSKGMIEGSAFHTALLEPHLFEELYTFGDKRTKEAKESGKIVLTELQYNKAKGRAQGILATQTAQIILKDALIEKAFYWRDPDTDILCKAKPDIVNLKLALMSDPKSTTNCSDWSIRNSIKDYMYYVQTAFHLAGVQSVYPQVKDYLYIFVEDEAPFGVRFPNFTKQDLDRGIKKYKEALIRYKTAMETGIFPGYPEEIITLEVFPQEAV